MIDNGQLLRLAAGVLPIVLLALLNAKLNLKKKFRSRQFLMPVIALLYCIAAMLLLDIIYPAALHLVELLQSLLARIGLNGLIDSVNLPYWGFLSVNVLLMAAYLVFKRIVVTILRAVFRTGNSFYEAIAGAFYDYDEDKDRWFVRESYGQLRGLMKALYVATVAVTAVLFAFAERMYAAEPGATSVFYLVVGVILVGEIVFFLCGETKSELQGDLAGEDDTSVRRVNYALMREVLSRLFPDKRAADSTQMRERVPDEPVEELLDRLCGSDDPAVETYGKFMLDHYRRGNPVDRDRLYSGLDLLGGKSVLLNDPFYWDHIPYLFYPIQRKLLQGKKILILLGRNDTEDDVKTWAETGLLRVNSTPGLWTVDVLRRDMEQLPDVGIVTRSAIHDLELHEACAPFFAQTEMAVVLEPSKLLPTAQIGLNCIAKRLQKPYTEITWCAIDKNCDGLVDALSHALLTDLREVAATEIYSGVSSYMLWDADSDHLQHRLLPNISRYLGFGTELSFAALKNQIEKTFWYGGEAFPVEDIHWIAKQYYADLLEYAELPQSQEVIDETFVTSHNLWSAQTQKNAYLTVEDEAHNMFEMRRTFSTRATEQGFINLLSGDYLLKDYMADNADIFAADAKAIPYIVADYVRSRRNIALRLIVMMSSGAVREDAIRAELALIGVDEEDPIPALWDVLCAGINPIGTPATDSLTLPGKHGELLTFTQEVIASCRKYDLDSGKVHTLYYVEDRDFIRALASQLQNVDCIAEDEKGQTHFLGSELRGQIFQKHLPGQFFTMDGKYYEMLKVTPGGQLLLRRAADHITGRAEYRQVREYVINAITEDEEMGASREIGGMRIARCNADITVHTPAYWQMAKYSDFETAKRVAVNAIPERVYCNKQILKICLPDEKLTPEVRYTITVLFNEVFRSLFAENQPFLAATMPGAESFGEKPLTYLIRGEGCDLEENTIYLIEDSQMDLGLLTAAERSLQRVFEIICDYLDWHGEAVEKSKNPPTEEVPEFKLPTPEPIPEKESAGKRFKRKVGDFFRKIGGSVFKKKKKPTDDAEPEPTENEPVPTDPEPEQITQIVPEEPAEEPAQETEGSDDGTPQPDEDEPSEPAGESAGEDASDDAQDAEPETEPAAEPDAAPDAEPDAEPDTESDDEMMLFSMDGELPPEEGSDEPVTTEFESEKVIMSSILPERRPYHERHFLLFGGAESPASIAAEDTLSYLQGLGYGGGSLKQARSQKDMAEWIAQGNGAGSDGLHQCDFCGRPLTGIEHEVLADGRERCGFCSRSAVRTVEEFDKILHAALQNMQTFFDVQITAPVQIRVVNAKKLHNALGKTFVPTGKMDGRVLGVAIHSRNGYSILVENGAPRLKSTMTLVHELTHIWQYLNWDAPKIRSVYGAAQELEVYEGMAKWVEIQYAYLLGEYSAAQREELITRMREDEYGNGFVKYAQKYPLRQDIQERADTPFSDPTSPL